MELKGKLLINPRMRYLYKQAYDEEKLSIPSDLNENIKPVPLIYPRSFVELTRTYHKNENDKLYDYNFIGSYFRSKVASRRKWIFPFAKDRFTDKSYLLISDAQKTKKKYNPLGSYDISLTYKNPFVPSGKKKSCTYFDENYFKVMSNSKFTLCPAGDADWSMRFSEAIMCKSIPIVEKFINTGRNIAERDIGYKFYYITDIHFYDQSIIDHNYKLFLDSQTIINSKK